MSKLTPQEEQELATLEAEFGGKPSGGLTPDEDAELAALEAEFAPRPNKPAADASDSWQVKTLDGIAGGLAGLSQGLTAGFADEMTGGLEAVYDDVKSVFTGGPAGNYEASRDKYRGAVKDAAEAAPLTYGAANIAGAVASPISKIPGVGAGRFANASKAITQGLAQGAIQGLGESEELSQDGLSDALTGAAMGSGFGAAGSAVGAVGSKIADKLPEWRRAMALNAIKPHMGDMLRLEDRQIADRVADAVSEVAFPGMGGAKLSEKLGQKVDEAGRTIGAIRQEADDLGAAVNLDRPRQRFDAEAAFSEGPGKKGANLAADWADEYATNGAQRSVGDTAEILSDLAEHAKYDKIGAITPEASAAQNLRREYVSSMEGAMGEKLGAERMGDYAKAKDTFGMYKEADKLLDKNLARQSTKSPFGFRDLVAAKGVSGGGKGVLGTAQDIAAAMSIKLVRERGGTTGAWAAGKLEKALANNPNAGKYAQAIAEAAGRGANALDATIHTLQQTDPEFRQMMNEENK